MFRYAVGLGLLMGGVLFSWLGCASNGEQQEEADSDDGVHEQRDEDGLAQGDADADDAPAWLTDLPRLYEGAIYAVGQAPFRDPDMERIAVDQATADARLKMANKAYEVTYAAVRRFLQDYEQANPEFDASPLYERIQQPPFQTRTVLSENLDYYIGHHTHQGMSFAHVRVRMPADALRQFAHEESLEVLETLEPTEAELAALDGHIDAALQGE